MEFIKKILKSLLVKILIAAFALVIACLLALPYALDNAGLKFQIQQKINKIYGANFIIYGDVKVSLIPFPVITAQDVVLQNYQIPDSKKVYNLYSKSASMRLGFKSYLGLFSVKKINFEDAIFETYYISSNLINRQNKFTEISSKLSKDSLNSPSKSLSGVATKLFSIDGFTEKSFANRYPKILLENALIISYGKNSEKKELSSVSGFIDLRSDYIKSEGSFSSSNILSNFKFVARFNEKSGKKNSVLEIISPALSFKLSGNFSSENKAILSDFTGKIDAEISDLKLFYKSYFAAENDVAFNKIKQGIKSIKISSDIRGKDGVIDVENLLLNSEVANGKGNIDIDFSGENCVMDLDLELDDLNLDSILSDEPVATSQNLLVKTQQNSEDESSQDYAKNNLVDLKLASKIKDLDLTSEIKIKSVKYLEGEIKDVDLYASLSKSGEILIMPMIFKIPGEGLVHLSGVLDSNGDFPKFVGKINGEGKFLRDVFKWMKIGFQNFKPDNLKNYQFCADTLLTLGGATLNNFYLNLNGGQSEFLGDLTIDSSEKDSKIITRFEVTNFNVDDYFLTSQQNTYLSPGSLMRKLLWLNDISSKNDISLNFDSLTYKGETFGNQKIQTRFGRGYFEIVDLKLKSDKTDLNANLSIDVSDKIPKFEMSVLGNKFHYETIGRVDQSQALQDKSNSVFKSSGEKKNIADQFFALPSLEGFFGKISLNIKDLKLDDLEVKNLDVSGNLKDGNLNILNFATDAYGGKLSYKGMISLRMNKTINGNLTFNDALIQPLMTDLFGIKNLSGISNIAASVTSVASTKKEFLQSLTADIKFSANAPSIDGYGLNDLVRKMFSSQTYKEELKNPEKILLNPKSKTVFKQADGIIQVDNGAGKIRINTSATALNGILSGKIDFGAGKIDSLFNVIFLTGNKTKQIPINIATTLSGSLSNINQATNLDQIKQYFGMVPISSANSANPNSAPSATTSVTSSPSANQIPASQNSQQIQVTDMPEDKSAALPEDANQTQNNQK